MNLCPRPLHGGAVIEVAKDAWFLTLDAATSPQIISPNFTCPSSSSAGCSLGCASDEPDRKFGGNDVSAPPPVTIVHQGTVGPYQTVTLHSSVPDALPSWLTANGYAIDPTIAPVIDAFAGEGFDFIALKLQPGKGVQAMSPVRVVTPGMSASLPLRMVAAGTGSEVAITLFVIGEGRWEAQNFPNGQIDAGALTWDFDSASSNYGTARQQLLATNGGRTWNNAYAEQGPFLQGVTTVAQSFGGTQGYAVGGQQYVTIAEAYFAQGVANGEGTASADDACVNGALSYAGSTELVAACSSGGSGGGGAAGTGGGGAGGSGTGGAGGGSVACSVPPGDIAAQSFACDGMDDLAIALVGMHPSSVWLTRLEAVLPRAALATDSVLQASATQTTFRNAFQPSASTGNPCGPVASVGGGASRRRLRERLAVVAAVLAAVGAALGRRRRTLQPVRVRALSR